MVTLCLGVVDVGYSDGEGTKTTGDVAGYLEDQYHIMRTFLELYEDQIGEFLADAMVGEIESMAQGRPLAVFGKDLNTSLGKVMISGASVNGKIERAFNNYLDLREWKQTSGQSVEAANQGVSHRKKQPLKKRPARAEFVDTGLYAASFRAWTE
ncbi:hypothetical protein SAMN05216466_10779 [Paraburkholderia phenazinium]|uniref:Uncharacterized protein n=1 Tax=Paraburkholderia phenazinium TaxID=60549 RepID=A0A1G7ZLA0_9BURK|nr:hypothetical protein [Paraburkholderia phenazinium]SDH09483.1 hypothetical protein SAMN05216466_10779 [Paraburkholderia phenazinium]